ncbi:MAG: outer membrane lipoprotein carrier protein LolA [Bryobacteraceae bacterium]|nr:outer membrane lipoprotein carrier protein LolA [Bryobacteraceae bacterium]
MLSLTKLCAALLCLGGPLAADTLKDVLGRMDKSAAGFQSVTAKVRKAAHTAVLNEDDVESGTMWMIREGKSLRMRIEFTEPDPRSVGFRGRKAEIYYPKINTVQEYDLGQHAALVDQFLLLGFGTKGSDLARDYHLKYIGEEAVGGARTDLLELVPKSKKALEQLSKVELWVAKAGYPVQQKFHWPSDDTTTITYTEIDLNPNLSDADVALKVPAGAKREYPQKQ